MLVVQVLPVAERPWALVVNLNVWAHPTLVADQSTSAPARGWPSPLVTLTANWQSNVFTAHVGLLGESAAMFAGATGALTVTETAFETRVAPVSAIVAVTSVVPCASAVTPAWNG